MSVGGAVALAAAEQVERIGGARAGLVGWRTLAANTADNEVRAKALLAGLRCAALTAEKPAIADLIARWETIEHGLWEAPIVGLALILDPVEARALVEAELRRRPTARLLYLRARLTDDAAAFTEAIARAERESAMEIVVSARVRRAEMLARSWITLPEALDEAARVAATPVAPPESRLAAARIQLISASRFVRASAIGVLDELTNGPLARQAIAAAARFVDESGLRTPLEHDRLTALFSREHVQRVAPRALETLRAIASGKDAPGLAPMRPLPGAAMVAAEAALAGKDASLREAAVRFFRLRLARVEPGAPPRGYLALAEALARAGAPDVAELARYAAAALKEPGAVDALGTAIAREGWELAAKGDRVLALVRLREARAIQLRK